MDHNGSSKVRIAIVTERNAPAHALVLQTLSACCTPADEAHLVGSFEKRHPWASGAHIIGQ